MESSRKALELQAQVRQNAEQMRSTLSELYEWEKDMKKKDEMLRKSKETSDKSNFFKNVPIRSHVKNVKSPNETVATASKTSGAPTSNATVSPATHKELNNLANAAQNGDSNVVSMKEHERANEIKDRGNKFVKVGKFREALNEYTNAIDIYKSDPVYYTNRALCYLKLEKYQDCIDDCERALEFDKLLTKAHYRRMQANENLGNYMDALKDCTTILTIEPKNSEAKKSLDRISRKINENVNSKHGPNFSPLQPNMIEIVPIYKPPHKRSREPMQRIPITDVVVGRKDEKNSNELKISDEDIEKLFNSNCGPFVEVKKQQQQSNNKKSQPTAPKTAQTTKTNLVEPIVDSNKFVDGGQQKIVPKKPKERCIGERDAKPELLSSTSQRMQTMVPEQQEQQQQQHAPAPQQQNERTLPEAPTTTAQFYSNWRELMPEQKYKYLKSIQIPLLCKVLGASLDSETLVDIINTLHDYYLPNEDPTTAETLLEISKNKQISILSLFLTNDDKKALVTILKKLKESNTIASTIVTTIAENFNQSSY